MLRPNRGLPQGAGNLFGRYQRPTILTRIIQAGLPEEYQKFFKEWRIDTPSAVHYVPPTGRFQRNPKTGEVKPVQDYPFPLRYPEEINEGIWGGEAIVQGFQKREKTKRRVPHFWVPNLKKSAVYSLVLDRYMSVTVTERTIEMIHKHQGFDKYLLETKACDLMSLLALKLKRQILMEIKDGCPSHRDNPKKQLEILNQYKHYAEVYTPREIEWYGLSFPEAMSKLRGEIEAANQPFPLKHSFRIKLVDDLKKAELSQAEVVISEDGKTILDRKKPEGWLSKINPFAKS